MIRSIVKISQKSWKFTQNSLFSLDKYFCCKGCSQLTPTEDLPCLFAITSLLKMSFLFAIRIQRLDRQIVKKQVGIMPTYHYVQNQGKLMMQSQENGQKPQFGQFFDNFEVKYLQIANSSEKQVSLKLKIILTSGQKPKKSLEPFLRKISMSDFGIIWRRFCEYLQIKIFFQKSGSITFLPL